MSFLLDPSRRFKGWKPTSFDREVETLGKRVANDLAYIYGQKYTATLNPQYCTRVKNQPAGTEPSDASSSGFIVSRSRTKAEHIFFSRDIAVALVVIDPADHFEGNPQPFGFDASVYRPQMARDIEAIIPGASSNPKARPTDLQNDLTRRLHQCIQDGLDSMVARGIRWLI